MKQGVLKVAGWSGHWEVYCEAMFSKPMFGIDFIENNFVWVRFSEKPWVYHVGHPVVSVMGRYFRSGSHHVENPAGTNNFVTAKLLCCLVLWLMDMGLFLGTKSLPIYRLLTLLRVHQSAVSFFDKVCWMRPAEWRLFNFRVLLSMRASLLFRISRLVFGKYRIQEVPIHLPILIQ